ncbi:MAG: hypothetical protein SCK28_00770 [Bacillota bacterium]|nr:hypothetical protein [Bacillota bacterium]
MNLRKWGISWTTDASGARTAAMAGMVTVIVDVIDMSTSIEVCLKEGALAAFGASPLQHKCPVDTNPILVAEAAVKKGAAYGAEIIIITEPRVGTPVERAATSSRVIEAIKEKGGSIAAILPNLGSEIGKLANFNNKVVIAVTATGGTAFDAAFNVLQDERITTATIARIPGYKGIEVAEIGLKRAISLAKKYDTGIVFVAASGNSIEDVLAAQYLSETVSTMEE